MQIPFTAWWPLKGCGRRAQLFIGLPCLHIPGGEIRNPRIQQFCGGAPLPIVWDSDTQTSTPMAYCSLTCTTCHWITQCLEVLPKSCGGRSLQLPMAQLEAISIPYAQPTGPQRNYGQSHRQAPSHVQLRSGSQDSMPTQSSQAPMAVDGNEFTTDPKDLESETARLTVQIQRQEKVLVGPDPQGDGISVQQRRTIIDQAKRSIIALNSPQDQLCTLQQAVSRRRDKSLQLSLQISALQQQLGQVQSELQDVTQQEKH